MYCSDAEEILNKRCPNFYRKFKEKHENDDTVVFPIPEDKFDRSEAPTPQRLYWEEKLKRYYPASYAFYLQRCTELNAFVLYVGCEVYGTNPDVAAELGNYRALCAQYQDNPSEDIPLWRMQDLHPQAGNILRAKLLCEMLKKSHPRAKNHAQIVDDTMGALDCAISYEHKNTACCVKFDPTLALPVKEILQEFLTKKLITPQDLERRDCANFLTQEDDGKESKKVKSVTLTY